MIVAAYHAGSLKHAMFDIDGTLIQSYDFDDECYKAAVKDVTGIDIKDDWSTYPHVTDRGLLMTFIERQAPNLNMEETELRVKSSFIQKISEHLSRYPINEVNGASKFLARLLEDKKYTVSLATGGWRETALLKLKSAGFDTEQIILSSSSEHHSRTEVMKLSAQKVGIDTGTPFTYFGDAEWDVRACRELGVNLVIVGDRVRYSQSISDYTDPDAVMDYII